MEDRLNQHQTRGRKTRRRNETININTPLKRSQSVGDKIFRGGRRRMTDGLADIGGGNQFQKFLGWVCNGKKDDYGRSKILLLSDSE